MIRALLLAAWCTALVLQAQAPRDTHLALTPAGTASLAGLVMSDGVDPKPLRRALVTLNGDALPIGRTVITADDGTFVFSGLPAGRYALAAAKAGYVAINYGSTRPFAPMTLRARLLPNTGLSVAEGESRRVTLRLPRGAVLSGMVTDGDGQSVKGATILPLAYRFNAQTGQRLLSAAGPVVPTDDRGMYRIYGLPAGEYVIQGQPPGVIGGLPAADTRLTTSSSRRVVTVPVFFPSATDVSRASDVTVAAGEERDGLDIQMQAVPAATISGTNTESTSATMSLIRPNDLGTERIQTVASGRDGQFVFTGIAPGHYTIVARAVAMPSGGGLPSGSWMSGSVWGSADVVVDGEDVSDVSIPMAPPFSISGRLVFEGRTPALALPLLGMPLPISTVLNAAIPPPSLQLLEGGRFTLSGLVPVAYRVSNPNVPGIRAPIGGWWLESIAIGGHELLDSTLDLRQGSDEAAITLSDQASEVSGTLRDPRGAPGSGTYVIAFTVDRAGWFFGSRRVAGVRTDSQGRYAIRNLPPGEYRIVATGDVDPGEWFDPTVLERLLPAASPITVAGVEKTTRDLVIR